MRAAVVPAAGLGTRLLPATLAIEKELLPLGRHPALCATLLEAQAAGITDLYLVLAPGKDGLRRFLDPDAWGAHAPLEALQPLRRLLAGLRIHFVEQPGPLGALDAIERGLRLSGWPAAVLFPDLVQLPEQRALATLLAAHAACGEAIFGLYYPDAVRHGPSVRVELDGGGRPAPTEIAVPRRIAGVLPPRPGEAELRTTFGFVHTERMQEALDHVARVNGRLDDGRYPGALDRLARAGGLYGVLLDGEIVDLGVVPGYLDAARRFAAGEARLRGL